MTDDKLSIVDIGMRDEYSDIVETAVRTLITQIDERPAHLKMRIVCSIISSICYAQVDPEGTFALIGIEVGSVLHIMLTDTEGNS